MCVQCLERENWKGKLKGKIKGENLIGFDGSLGRSQPENPMESDLVFEEGRRRTERRSERFTLFWREAKKEKQNENENETAAFDVSRYSSDDKWRQVTSSQFGFRFSSFVLFSFPSSLTHNKHLSIKTSSREREREREKNDEHERVEGFGVESNEAGRVGDVALQFGLRGLEGGKKDLQDNKGRGRLWEWKCTECFRLLQRGGPQRGRASLQAS